MRAATNARIPRATTATMYAFPNDRRARANSLMVHRSDHDRVAAPHVRLGLSESFHNLCDDAVQQEDRRVFEQRPERREAGLRPISFRVNQEDDVARVPQLRGAMSGDGNHLRPDAASDVRDLDRTHRRAGVRDDEDRVAIADDGRDRLPDEITINPQLHHPHRERARGESTPTDAVHKEFLRGCQDANGFRNLFRAVHGEDLREMVEELCGRGDGRGGVWCRGRPALHRRFAPRSSFSPFSVFVGRMRRFAKTRSRMTFMYIFTRRSWSCGLHQRDRYFCSTAGRPSDTPELPHGHARTKETMGECY